MVNPKTLAAYKLAAVIDTGAFGYYLKNEAILALGLNKTGEVEQMHPIEGLTKLTPIYVADIVIQGFLFENKEIQTLYHDKYPVSLILGCSFLDKSLFIYDWINKTISIDFPGLKIPVWPHSIS